MSERTTNRGDGSGDRRRAPRRRARAAAMRSAEPVAPCVVRSAIELLQEKWVLHIIHTLLDGPRGFNDLGRAVGGCNPTTLAQRLARLEEAGIVSKGCGATTDGVDGAGRSVYRLTPAGQAFDVVVAALGEWARTHFDDERSTLA